MHGQDGTTTRAARCAPNERPAVGDPTVSAEDTGAELRNLAPPGTWDCDWGAGLLRSWFRALAQAARGVGGLVSLSSIGSLRKLSKDRPRHEHGSHRGTRAVDGGCLPQGGVCRRLPFWRGTGSDNPWGWLGDTRRFAGRRAGPHTNRRGAVPGRRQGGRGGRRRVRVR